MTTQIDHPDYYRGENNPYEAIKVIESWGLGFCLGNTLKYIARAGHKGDRLEDLRKARWYLDREIQFSTKNFEKEYTFVFLSFSAARQCFLLLLESPLVSHLHRRY